MSRDGVSTTCPRVKAAIEQAQTSLNCAPSQQVNSRCCHQPNDQQSAAFEALKTASAKAADVLNGTCPSQTPATPGVRLDAMAKRLDATAQAVKAVRPALQEFYVSLNDEQKARFNTMNLQGAHQG
jgi:hypothetical protein